MITFNLVDGRQPHLRILRSWKTSRASSSSRLNQKYLAGGCSIKTAGGEKEREGKGKGGRWWLVLFSIWFSLGFGYGCNKEGEENEKDREGERENWEGRKKREGSNHCPLSNVTMTMRQEREKRRGLFAGGRATGGGGQPCDS